MKALIWTGCIIGSLVATIIFNVILQPFGLRLGWKSYSLAIATGASLAAFLCKKKVRKSVEKKLEEEGVTSDEYIMKHVPEKNLEMCEFYRGKSEELESYLKTLLEDGKITKEAYVILFEKYGEK